MGPDHIVWESSKMSAERCQLKSAFRKNKLPIPNPKLMLGSAGSAQIAVSAHAHGKNGQNMAN